MFTWKPFSDKERQQRELVAQLDQIYAYMMWVSPSLPEKLNKEWEYQLTRTANIIIEQFWSEKNQFFWGSVTSTTNNKEVASAHTDFGHSIKTLWLIYRIGILVHDPFLTNFGREKVSHLLELAYLKDGTWAKQINKDGTVNNNKEWWSLAILDQVSATLALSDPNYIKYIQTTYPFWLNIMTDKEHHEIFHMVDGNTRKPVLDFPKQHNWKNSFHSFEHALVCYITSNELNDENTPLYYAFKPEFKQYEDTVFPYLFLGNIASVTASASEVGGLNGFRKVKVEFNYIH